MLRFGIWVRCVGFGKILQITIPFQLKGVKEPPHVGLLDLESKRLQITMHSSLKGGFRAFFKFSEKSPLELPLELPL